ncbi:MAG: DUF2953 domain-containing protein [Lachnospiraceae bacterium]|nr:DUF2953 domain-containing protein [Lachnospiraceae bacterium]
MGTLLLILKIIGIILLVVLAVVFIILFLILFVPIRYKGKLLKEDGEDKPVYASAVVSWLLHIISVTYEYRDKAGVTVIKIFGIRLRSREEKVQKKTEKDSRKETEDITLKPIRDEGKTHFYTEENVNGTDIRVPADEEEKTEEEKIKEDKIEEEKSISDKAGNKTGFADKIKAFVDKLKTGWSEFWKKVENIKSNVDSLTEKISYYQNALFNDSVNREAVGLIIIKLKRLIRAVKPRKTGGFIEIGMEDPADMGKILAASAMLYPVYGKNIEIRSDFENKVLDFDVWFKGRIYLCVIVKVALQLYFNKKVRRFIRIMRRSA